MNDFSKLSISIDSLMNETKKIISFLDNDKMSMILYARVIDADIDIKSYCSLSSSVKQSSALFQNDDAEPLTQKLNELPDVNESDFMFQTMNLPSAILFIFFPLGILIWLTSYFKLSALIDKLRAIESKLGTIEFMLKAYNS